MNGVWPETLMPGIALKVQETAARLHLGPGGELRMGYAGRSCVVLYENVVLKVFFRDGQKRYEREVWGLEHLERQDFAFSPRLLDYGVGAEGDPWIIMSRVPGGFTFTPETLPDLTRSVAALHARNLTSNDGPPFERGRLTANTQRNDCISTFVHGDLSLRNVISTHAAPVLIDFENSGVGCGVRDVVRLLFVEEIVASQDAVGGFIEACLGTRDCTPDHLLAHSRDHVAWVSSWAPTVDVQFHRQTLELETIVKSTLERLG